MRIKTRINVLLFHTLLFATLLPVCSSANADFPRPASLEAAVQFWARVYTEVGTNGGFIHDPWYMDVVYEKVEFPKNTSRSVRRNRIKAIKARYKAVLETLAKGKRTGLSKTEKRVLAMFPKNVSNEDLADAADRVRFQLGQANKFRQGLVRAGRWRAHILKILQEENVPLELASLPHVESSFNPRAYSHVGAAGLWQFMRSTGRRFMRVDNVIDERMDPYESSRAAAQLLKYNYASIQSWPLAITAYNHGLGGMRRAVRTLGTRDISEIVRYYEGRTFGFASRNFYTAFLAARQVDENPEEYFGKIRPQDVEEIGFVEVPDYLHVNSLSKALGLKTDTLQEYNPALRGPIWAGKKRIPRGYQLRLPVDMHDQAPVMLASIPDTERFTQQTRNRTHRVRRGQTLSKIAARYKVSLRELMAINGLRKRSRIRVGQVIKLPIPATEMMAAKSSRSSEPVRLAALRKPEPGSAPVKREQKPKATVKVATLSTPQTVAKAEPVRKKARKSTRKQRKSTRKARESKRIKVAANKKTRKARRSKDKGKSKTYRVEQGDTLWEIGRKFGVSERELMAANDLSNRHRIYAGQVLRVAHNETATKKPSIAKKSTAKKSAAKKPSVQAKKASAPKGVVAKAEATPAKPAKPAAKPEQASAAKQAPTKLAAAESRPAPANTKAPATEADQATPDAKAAPAQPALAKTAPASGKPADGKAPASNSAATDNVAAKAAPVLAAAASAKPAAQAAADDAIAKTKAVVQADQVAALTPPAEGKTTAEEAASADEEVTDTGEAGAAGLRAAGGIQTDLSADPNDYEVSKDNSVEVQAAETLGHYAEWLEVRAHQLRRLNRMRYRQPVVIGDRVQLDFSVISAEEFEKRRMAYHRSLQETFFQQYHIKSTLEYQVQAGDSLWKLYRKHHNVPIWLLRQYNPDQDLSNLKPGTKLRIPRIAQRPDKETPSGDANSEPVGMRELAPELSRHQQS